MTAEALHIGRTTPASEPVTPLALFAAVLLATPSDPDTPVIGSACRRAVSESERALRTGREPLSSESWLPYRALYRTWKEQAAAVKPAPPDGTLTVALRALRHRQRAVLALRRVTKMPPDAVARVVGCRSSEVEPIALRSEAVVARALGRPFDLARELGAAPAGPAPAPKPLPAPARVPRRVVRDIVAGRAPVPDPSPERPHPPRRRTNSSWVAAVVAAVLLGVVLPVSARIGARPAVPLPVAHAPAATTPSVLAKRHVPSAAPRTMTVSPGDTLWAIAARTLGDPLRWHEIWSRNRGRRMTTGERFTDADLIRPGWRLLLPDR